MKFKKELAILYIHYSSFQLFLLLLEKIVENVAGIAQWRNARHFVPFLTLSLPAALKVCLFCATKESSLNHKYIILIRFISTRLKWKLKN